MFAHRLWVRKGNEEYCTTVQVTTTWKPKISPTIGTQSSSKTCICSIEFFCDSLWNTDEI